jgi:SAM-dependent methyltransferase
MTPTIMAALGSTSSPSRPRAAVYDLPGNPVVAQEEPHVQALIGLPGEPVLDAGCGTGRHLAWLGAHGRAVIGVDQSPEMLARARVKVPDADLRPGQLESLPADDQAVAGVVCALALEHVAESAIVGYVIDAIRDGSAESSTLTAAGSRVHA